MEAIEVIARFEPTGEIYPLRLRRQDQEYLVEAVGRRWQAEDGLHVLVLTTTRHAFELLFDMAQGRWYLAQAPADQKAA